MRVKTVSLLLVVAAGLVLVIFPFATSMFDKTQGVEKLTGDFRDSFTPAGVKQTQADLTGVVAGTYKEKHVASQSTPMHPEHCMCPRQ